MAILSTLLLTLSGSYHSMLWFLILRCTKSQDPLKGIVIMLQLSPVCKLSIVCTWFQSLVRWWMLPGVDNILEVCKTFFVNPYVRHLDFLLFCYLITWYLLLLYLTSHMNFTCWALVMRLNCKLNWKNCTVGGIFLWDHNNLQWRHNTLQWDQCVTTYLARLLWNFQHFLM